MNIHTETKQELLSLALRDFEESQQNIEENRQDIQTNQQNVEKNQEYIEENRQDKPKKVCNNITLKNVFTESSNQSSHDVLRNFTNSTSDLSLPTEICPGEDFQLAKFADTKLRKESTEASLTQLKKRKKRRYLTICTTNCKYDVVRRVAARFGMKEVTEDSSWNLYWTDLSVSIERAKDMKRYQKVNHFPGMTEICRKDLLARNLNRMLKLFPKDYNFFPKTWCFPADHGEAVAYSKLKRAKTFIIKPDTGCQGRGIYLTKNLKDIKPNERMVCQVYVSKPFLIDGYKFDLRIYTLVTSCDPLRIYVYNDGLARFATSRYKEPTGQNASNVFMHLTNYAVNKHSRMYIIDDETGSKRKISTLVKWMRLKDIDVDELWKRIDELIIKTILAAYPILKHSYHACFSTHDRSYACFELLGFDVLLDWKLKPYLLEVNHSPSFHTDTQIDKDIKESLLADTFEMLNLQQCDKKKIIEEDRRRVRERLLQGLNSKDLLNDTIIRIVDKSQEDYAQSQQKWEDEHTGNFRRIYPSDKNEKYEPFFKQNNISVFQDTVASKAREEAARVQKEEIIERAREVESKRLSGKWSDSKLNPESPQSLKRLKSGPGGLDRRKPHSASARVTFNAKTKKDPIVSSNGLSSFEPELISESEERERIMGLAQRDFLVKSYGVLEQIYMAMRKNGTLRPIDEEKYGLYGKLAFQNEINKDVAFRDKCPHHHHRCGAPQTEISSESWTKNSQYPLPRSKGGGASVGSSVGDLKVTCNEARVYVRPDIPKKFWLNGLNSKEQSGRITKTHVARTLLNSVRLHTLEQRKILYFSELN